ncbi:MAG: tetratricopeptide repeat protein [Planctomycetales bacterium]
MSETPTTKGPPSPDRQSEGVANAPATPSRSSTSRRLWTAGGLIALAGIAVWMAIPMLRWKDERQRFEEELRLMQFQARRADENLQDAVAAVERLSWIVQDDDPPSGALEPWQRQSLEEALAFHKRFAKKNSGSESYQSLAASSMVSAVQLQHRLGRDREAVSQIEEARQLLTGVMQAEPHARRPKVDNARLYFSMGEIMLHQGQPDAAESPLTSAQSGYTKLREESPAEPAFAAALARIHDRLARVQAARGQGELALESWERSLALLDEVPAAEAAAFKVAALRSAYQSRSSELKKRHLSPGGEGATQPDPDAPARAE